MTDSRWEDYLRQLREAVRDVLSFTGTPWRSGQRGAAYRPDDTSCIQS